MEAPVIAAIIAATGLITGAIIAALVANRNKATERKKMEAEIQKFAAETKKLEKVEAAVVEAVIEDQLGYRVRELYSETVIDENGDAQSRRRWLDLTVTKATSHLRVDFRCRTTGTPKDPEVFALPGSAHQVHFDKKPGNHGAGVIEGWIVIDGYLIPGQRVSFEVAYESEGSFTTSQEQTLEKYKGEKCMNEYAVTDANVAAEVMTRKVTLPPSHRNLQPPPQAVVFLGKAENEEPDFDELARVQTGFLFAGDSGVLKVTDPKLGRRYGIGWTPPRKSVKLPTQAG